MKKAGIWSAFKILWKIGDHKDRFIFIFTLLLGLIETMASILSPFVITCIIAKISGEDATILWIHFSESLSTTAVVFICFGILFGFKILSMLVRANVRLFGSHMKTKINVYALNLLLEHRKNFDLGMSNGEASYIIKNASEHVDTFVETFVVDIFWRVLSSVVSIVYITYLNPITLAVLTGTIMLLVLTILFRAHFDGKVYKKLENISGKISNHALNNIENLSYVGFLKSKKLEIKISKELNRTYFKMDKRKIYTYITYWILTYSIEFISAALVVFLILNKGMKTIEVASALIVVITYLLRIFDSLDSLGAYIGLCQRYGVTISRVELIKTNPEMCIKMEIPTQTENLISVAKLPENARIEKIEIKKFDVKLGTFENVYDVSFEKGMLNCIVGESGKGKTTLIRSMIGLVEHKEGYIVINNKYKLNNLFFDNDRISISFQDGNLFDRSLSENLVYPDIELNEKTKKKKKKFSLKKLFDREDELGENIKSSLSGGEKKRLNFIRCIQKEAEVYIIDEPTNDLDEENVKKVIKEIEKLKKKAVVIVISHDMRLVERAENLILL